MGAAGSQEVEEDMRAVGTSHNVCERPRSMAPEGVEAWLRWRRGGQPMSDARLVGEVARGDEEALVELYRRHGGSVWSLCLHVCRDKALAEDVCQTVFCEVWSAPWRFDARRGAFRSWLLALAHARAVDAVRSEAARRRREEHDVTRAPAAPMETDAQAHLASLADEVRAAVATLPDGERAAIVLTYFGGHTYREAAALLGAPEGTVKSRIRAGLRRLRTELDGAGATS